MADFIKFALCFMLGTKLATVYCPEQMRAFTTVFKDNALYVAIYTTHSAFYACSYCHILVRNAYVQHSSLLPIRIKQFVDDLLGIRQSSSDDKHSCNMSAILVQYCKEGMCIDNVAYKSDHVFSQTQCICADIHDLAIARRTSCNKRAIASCRHGILNTSFEASDIRFISFVVHLQPDNVEVVVKLKTETDDYYVVGNEIDKYFIRYYVNNILSALDGDTPKTHTPFTYAISLIDHNANVHAFDHNDVITIHKTDYSVRQIDDEKVNKE